MPSIHASPDPLVLLIQTYFQVQGGDWSKFSTYKIDDIVPEAELHAFDKYKTHRTALQLGLSIAFCGGHYKNNLPEGYITKQNLNQYSPAFQHMLKSVKQVHLVDHPDEAIGLAELTENLIRKTTFTRSNGMWLATYPDDIWTLLKNHENYSHSLCSACSDTCMKELALNKAAA